MRIFTRLDEISPTHFSRPVVTIGVFDGLHLGHQAILRDLQNMAIDEDGEGVVLTFDRHPDAILRGAAPPTIHSVPHRLLMLDRAGMDNAVVISFDESMAGVTAEGFIRDILKGRFGAVGLVMGPGNNFGKGGRGDAEVAGKLGSEFGLRVEQTRPITVEDKLVSSTAVRAAILEGDLDLAGAMLGRPMTLLGRVTRGAGRGRQIGFPTANLDVNGEIHPPNGVYVGTTSFQRRVYRSMVNIGVRPTFPGEGEKTIEVHLLDFKGDLYGLSVEVAIVSRIREEKKFDRVEDLVRQLEVDRAAAIYALESPAGM